MMFRLVRNIRKRSIDITHPDAEGPVTLLPRERLVIGELIVHPFRGTALDQLDRLRDRQRRGQG